MPTPAPTSITTPPAASLVPMGGGYGQFGSQAAPTTKPDTTAPTVSPTVISGSTISDKVIPDMQKRADQLSQKGTMVGQDGKMYYADGSLVPAPVDAEFDPTSNSYKSGNNSYGAAPQFVDNTNNDPELAKTNELFGAMKSSLDSNTLQQVTSIEQQYNNLRSMQQDANARADSAQTTLNLKNGTTRFAPLDAAGTALTRTTYGLQQIAKLDADENSAIAQVRQAQQSGDFQIMEKALATVESIRTAKQAAAQKLSDTLSAATEAAQKQQLQVAQDNAVAGLVGGGVTDPAEVLKQLNAAGYDATAADVAASIKNLMPTAAAGATYKFTNADTGKLLGAGMSPAQIQAVQDYYNGKGDAASLSNLSESQLNAVHTALNGPTKAATAGGPSKTYTSGGYTYTSGDLGKIQSWVSSTKGADGYVDPNAYQAAFDAWVADKGLPKDFLKNFPPKTLINPSNDWLPKYLSTHTSSSGSTGSSADVQAQIDQLFSK